MTLEDRFAAMEARLSALEQENQALRAAVPRRKTDPVPKNADAIREKIERELSPYQRMKIKELAMDVQRHGYDAAMEMHGRRLPKRGRKAA